MKIARDAERIDPPISVEIAFDLFGGFLRSGPFRHTGDEYLCIGLSDTNDDLDDEHHLDKHE